VLDSVVSGVKHACQGFSQIVIRVKLVVVKPSFHGISYIFVSQAQIKQTEIYLFR
jgi:hypothetical protein